MNLPTWVSDEVDPAGRSLVAAALAVGVIVVAGLVFFIGGEILADPGGWIGLGWVIAWLAPPLALSLLALLRPRWGYIGEATVIALLVVASLATWIAPDAFYEFEDTHGPVFMLALIAVLIPGVALGRSMPLQAGWLMVVAIVVPLITQSASLLMAGEPTVIMVLVVICSPFAVVAVLFILGDRAGSRTRRSVVVGGRASGEQSSQ